MDMGIHVVGLKEVLSAFDKVVAESVAVASVIVVEGAVVVEAAAKANFEGSHRKGMPHVGGAKPNVVSGTLRRSIRHTPVVREGLAGAMVAVGPTVIYARRVELGYNGSQGYPFFTPGVDDSRDKLLEIARRHWTRTTRG
jgi:hypothetical protein